MKPLAFLAPVACAAFLLVAVSQIAHPAAAPAATPAPQPLARVQTQPARQGPIAPTVRAYGSIDFASSDLMTLSLPYATQVTRLAAAPGQSVRAGGVLAELTADPAVAATFVQAESSATAAREELRRTESLFAEQLATQSQLAAARKASVDADATLAELRRQGAAPGPRGLRAPFDAVVVTVAAAQGDRLAAGAPVMQLGHLATGAGMHLTLGVDPARASQVKPGARVQVRPLDARKTPDAATADPAWQGRVVAVRQVLNPQTRLVDVGVQFDPSAGPARLPGTPVGAEIELAPSVHWIVPRSALLTDAQGDSVYQVAQGHAHRIAVTRAVEAGGDYGVDGPLVDGAPLVTLGNYELDDGMAVVEAAR